MESRRNVTLHVTPPNGNLVFPPCPTSRPSPVFREFWPTAPARRDTAKPRPNGRYPGAAAPAMRRILQLAEPTTHSPNSCWNYLDEPSQAEVAVSCWPEVGPA